MTKEQAIELIKADIKHWENTSVCVDHLYMAIKALEQQSDDCVSRAEVQEVVSNTIAKYIPIFIGRYEKIPLELALAIKDVPPVIPTHGTCKDCKHFHNVRKDFDICDLYTIACTDNHYCADFEK